MSAGLSLELKGLATLQAKLNQMAAALPGEVGNALRAEAEIEMTEAKKRTPLKTGVLRASGHVIGPVQEGNMQTVTLGFGGPAGIGNQGETNKTEVGYALYVHEMTENLHPLGQAKYLESTLLESIPYLAERIAKRIALNKLV